MCLPTRVGVCLHPPSFFTGGGFSKIPGIMKPSPSAINGRYDNGLVPFISMALRIGRLCPGGVQRDPRGAHGPGRRRLINHWLKCFSVSVFQRFRPFRVCMRHSCPYFLSNKAPKLVRQNFSIPGSMARNVWSAGFSDS